MPDPVMTLTEQHNRLRRLFKQVSRVGGHQSAEARARAICDQLTIHSRLEEELVYPVVEGLDSAMAKEAESAHQRIDALVEAIVKQDYANNGEVKADLDALEQDVESHSRWEEETLLPRVAALPKDAVDELGQRLYDREQELLREYPQALEISAETEGYVAAPRI
jgi:hemerythrin superfamily protein